MESKRLLFASSDENECYLYPKRIKIESNQKIIEKEEQQNLKQSIHSVNSYQTTPNEPVYLSEKQNSWALEKQTSENKQSTKKRSSENETQIPMKDNVSLNVCGQPLKAELHNDVSNAANIGRNLHGLNPSQMQQNNTQQNNRRNGDNDLKQNSSVTPLNIDLFQMEMLSHKSDSDKKWKKYQLLQSPFLCGTSSVFSHKEHEKNNFLKKVCTAGDKDYSSNVSETTIERDNKEKKNSSYVIPTLKPFKSLQLLEIPNFQFPSISNKLNSKMPSTHLKEMDLESFKGQSPLVQSQRIHGVQKMTETGKHKLQNDRSSVKASTVGSEFKEKNYLSVSEQEHGALAEGGKVSLTCFRDSSTDIECNQIFAENNFKDKMQENSDSDDDHKSRIYIYISAKNVQNEKCINCNDLLKRMGWKSSNDNTDTLHIQMNVPVITEALEKNKLDVYWDVRNSNSDIILYEAESKLSTKEILDFKRYFTKNIIFESNCPHSIVQNFPYSKISFNIFRGKEMFKLKFSFPNMLFAWVRTWAESLFKDMPRCQGGSVTYWFSLCETFNEERDALELVKRNINRSHVNKICICLLTIISKQLKVEEPKTIFASFFTSRSTLLSAGGKFVRVENYPLCGKKQVELNSCTDNTMWQITEFHEENETYRGSVNSKFVESIGLEFINEQQRCFSKSLSEGESTFLKKGTIFRNQKSGLCKGKHARKHHLLSRGSEGFSTYLRSVSRNNGMKRQSLVLKCLILPQGTFDCSSLDKKYCCKITKIQYPIGRNLRFHSYFPAHSQLTFQKVKSRRTNQEILVATVKQVKKKPSKIFNSSFQGERFTDVPFVLCENIKHETTGCRTCTTSTNAVTCPSSYINADKKEYVKSKDLQMNFHNLCSKKYLSFFDMYEKIPLTIDSEDLDKIPVVNQDSSVTKKLSEENAITCSKQVHNLPARSNDVLVLPEQSKTTLEKCNSVFLQGSQTNTREYCETIDTYSPNLANEKLEDRNIYLNFENLFPSSSDVYHSDTLPLDNRSSGNEERVISERGHCRSFSSADKREQSEKNHASIQYPSAGSPTMTNTDLRLQAMETEPFSLQEHTEISKGVSLEPTTLKHIEYVEEQEEISDEQMHVANESRCDTVMSDLIMSHSKDESKTFFAAEEKLKMHLPVMNNGHLEDAEDKYLPLENEITYEFELKKKFDLVLEELHMFHEISKGNENNLSSLETNSHSNYCELNNSVGIDENATSASQKKMLISSPICVAIEGQNITDNNGSSLNKKISNENEDENPSREDCTSRLSNEELLHSPVAEGYFDAAYNKAYTWNPAFLSCALFSEQNYNLPKEGGYFLSREVMRVQPLKTCKGPVKIGLSRKARPKQLHPYLK